MQDDKYTKGRDLELRQFVSYDGQLPGFVPSLRMDTQNCTLVVVFPRNRASGGTVNSHELVDKPLSRARRIFHTFACDSKITCERLKHIKVDDEPVSMELYQEDIRDRFIEILAQSGLEASQFSSLDGDETFLKIWLPEQGQVIDFMADALHYNMPLKETVYEGIEPHAPYPGGAPMENFDSQPVVAYYEFSIPDKKNFQDFRKVDSIRILSFWLNEWVSLDEMERQGVISCHFPCPDAGELHQIHSALLAPRQWMTFTPHTSAITIRRYFGEEIAFFFGFLGHLCRSLLFPGTAGLVFLIVTQFVEVEGHRLDGLRTSLCVPMSIWAASSLHVFERKTARMKQLWGVHEREAREMPNPDWNETPHTGEWGKLLSTFITLCFVTLYIADALALTLSGVKLLMTNFPFFYSCFLTNLVETKCGKNFQEVAPTVWPGFNESLIDGETKEALLKYTFTWSRRIRGREDETFCINGCFPPDWHYAREDSRTNCDYDVTANLLTYFVFLLVLDMVFLIWPIVLSRWEINKEYRNAEEAEDNQDFSYSILQWEAKKFQYVYDSWGGDRVTDFLDITVAYSVVACWGCILPTIATLALVVLFISMHLRMYRMLYVARRPLPHATAGLGIWKSIILYTNVAAVACNVGLASIFFYPMRLRPPGQQLTMFIIGEHVLFLLQAGVSAFVPEEPSDVIDIKYFNRHVLAILGRRRHHEQLVPPVHSNLNTIDLSLNPENWDSDSSVSSPMTSGSSRQV
eukprot:s257_g29.t1